MESGCIYKIVIYQYNSCNSLSSFFKINKLIKFTKILEFGYPLYK